MVQLYGGQEMKSTRGRVSPNVDDLKGEPSEKTPPDSLQNHAGWPDCLQRHPGIRVHYPPALIN
jgi:hypothetical protein